MQLAMPMRKFRADRCQNEEKKLGVLAKAMKRGAVKRLSDAIIHFLNHSVDESDATLSDVRELFPEARARIHGAVNEADPNSVGSIISHIDKGGVDFSTFTKEDIDSCNRYRLLGALARCTPQTFVSFHKNPHCAAYMMSKNNRSYIFDILIAGNMDLFTHVCAHGGEYGIDVADCVEYLQSDGVRNILCAVCRSREAYLECFALDARARRELYEIYISDMNIDAAMAFES